MNIIVVAKITVSLLYALLMVFATLASYSKTRRLDAVMLFGTVLLGSANLFTGMLAFTFALTGLAVIHIAALLNGRRQGKINPAHHVIRLAITIVILLLFWLA